MKKTILFISAMLILTSVFSSATFAEMKLDYDDGERDKIVYDPNHPYFLGNIVSSDYFYDKGKKTLAVTIRNDQAIYARIIFTDQDEPFGLALTSNMGNPAQLDFANAKLDIERLAVSPKNDYKTMLKPLARFKKPQ